MRRINGEQRIKRRFLFFPKTMHNKDGERETRWLERASWRQYWYAHGMWWMDIEEWHDA